MTRLQIVTRKTSEWLYANNSFVKEWRAKRFQKFLSLVKPPTNARIIDLGGTAYMWQLIDHNFEVTIVNLPSSVTECEMPDGTLRERLEGYNFVEGDATNLSGLFADKSFDIVFSNSVIEHVGDEKKQAAFAAEVRRLADAYWVQTPSNFFPLEAHTGVLFYWQLPQWVRDRLIRSWEPKLPVWTDMIKELRVLKKTHMKKLFPDAKIYIERKLLLEKSYSFYKPCQSK
ncbi:MAG: class I SAM-dependent methyltransferase [Hydrococcus sp. Prado102]|jgi:hypothetical protein|nr:class I SAM-dependent methyltransferase [Hydrococcus sp. Prado102]